MSKLSRLAVLFTLAILGACGGEAGEAVQGPVEEPEETPFLDFSLIEGDWSGTATQVTGFPFWIEVTLASGGERGSSVGTVRYGSGSTTPLCGGSWQARSAQDPVYIVSEQITLGVGDCPNGTVRLERSPESGTLRYDFTAVGNNPAAQATGTLARDD